MSMHYCQSFQELAPKYETFVFDIWGVIHNGVQLFPGVKDCIEALHKAGKRVCFLSNSPRAGANHETQFSSLGIDRSWYDFIYTSGDALQEALKICPDVHPTDPFFFIGDEHLHAPVLESMEGERAPIMEEARYILCTAPMMGYERFLEEGKAAALPLICSNPDRSALHGGARVVCAGQIAYEYEQRGGTVFYCGKPELFVYETLLKKLGNPNKSSVLAIGDGVFTDIQGACGAGLDSVLIDSGLHSQIEGGLESLCKEHNLLPTYKMDQVAW